MNPDTKWREYCIIKIFDIKRGMRLKSEDREKGLIPYFSASETNNGQTDSIRNPLFIEKDALIYSTFGDCFWIDGDFTASDEISILKHPKMSRYSGLFVATVLNQNKYKYAFGRKAFYNKFCNEVILLPGENEDEPDWEYMETYIKSLHHKQITTQIPKNNLEKDLNIKKWKEYCMSDIFLFKKGKRLTKADMIPGNLNFLGAISENNGVREKIETDYCYSPNCITVNYNGSVGESFYQSEPFWASDDVNVLYAKDFWEMNKYIAMFLITVIKTNKYRFGYGRKWTIEKMKETIIKLPSQADGTPDFVYMENYIKSLPYSDRI